MSQLSFEDFLADEKFYSVRELTKDIKFLLEASYASIWVQGEISNFSHHASGHMYFSLKDEEAQISCVMWRTRNLNLIFRPRDGMRVTVNGRVTVFERRGSYQLNVLQLMPAGRGELQHAFEQLKNRLNDEGLFSVEHKQVIPAYPECIGIVTSPDGAAIRDLATVLRRRFPSVEIVLAPVRVQGEGAASEIASAIDDLNEFGEADLLIVARGGGSLEDLWAFNEEIVARAVFRSAIPTISAVGHEIDFSICDFVADLRAPTPSAAAEMAVRSRDEIKAALQVTRENMTDSVVERIRAHRERLQFVQKSYAFRQPLEQIRQLQQRLDEHRRIMSQMLAHQAAMDRQRLTGIQKRLALLDHSNVLNRGYSICTRRRDGRLVRRSSDLQPGEGIDLRFAQGGAKSTIDEVFADT